MNEYFYNLPDISPQDFEIMRFFVETANKDSRKTKLPIPPLFLSRVTHDLDELPGHSVSQKDRTTTAVGLAWPGLGLMWVKSSRDLMDVQRTTIHELTHLRVAAEAHGPKWRRVFAVALAQWLHHKGMPWEEIRREIGQVVYRYRKYRQFTPQGRYNPYAQYLNRCEKEYRDLERIARRVCGIR